MERNEQTITISATLGSVSTISLLPEKSQALILLAHGAGAGMKHAFMESLAMELAELSIGSLRYNFPYMEQGRKRPDVPAIAEKTVEVMLNTVHIQYPDIPIVAAGKSFGGRMTSQLLAKQSPPFVKGIIFYGFPLHPAGKPSQERARHLQDVTLPMLFLQGTKDELAYMDLLEPVCKSLPAATLVKFEGADHAFKAGKKILTKELAEASAAWISK